MQEHRQRHRRQVQPLPMLWQVRFGDIDQLRAGQRVEELRRRSACGVAANPDALLLSDQMLLYDGSRLASRVSRWGVCLVTNILPIRSHAFSFPFSIA